LDHRLQSSTMIPRIAKLAAALGFLLIAPAPAEDLPEGAGKEIVMKVCTVCHDTEHFTTKRRTKDEWNDTVDTMAKRGAQASDEDFDTIVAYLAKNFGKDKPPVNAPAKDESSK
jgi:mono/diheme cytochrome c family protein